MPPLSTLSLLLAVAISLQGGGVCEEAYKGRRWSSAGGDGPYALVVSADQDHELHPQESVGYALVLQEKKTPKGSKVEEIPPSGKMMDKYDKVTERLMMKENRKRQRLAAVEGSSLTSIRKRRRNSAAVSPSIVSSTTGLPQTMSYNLYNHFRPIETDVPSEVLIPFLDFGRKLSTGATPGFNSIETSPSTPRATTTTMTSSDRDEIEDVSDDEMDVTVTRKAVERNSPPRLTLKTRKPTITAFFRRAEAPEPNATLNATPLTVRVELKEVNKTEKLGTTDLQSNESGFKPRIVLSPNYGLRLNKTDVEGDPEPVAAVRTTVSVEPQSVNTDVRPNVTVSPVERTTQPTPVVDEKAETLLPAETNVTPKIVFAVPVVNRAESNEKTVISHVQNEKTSDAQLSFEVENKERVVKTNRASEDLPDPSPTARILSTAVVTSVSVKESPRTGRIRPNVTEVHHRVNPMKADHNASEILIPPENRTSILQQLARRKFFTTFRPKTTSFRAVTFRSTFRRNSSYVPAVVHVVSTPPSYIEVPRIAPVRSRTTFPPLQPSSSEIVRKFHPQMNAALTVMDNRTDVSNVTEANSTSSTTIGTTSSSTTSTTTTTTTALPDVVVNKEIHSSTSEQPVHSTTIRVEVTSRTVTPSRTVTKTKPTIRTTVKTTEAPRPVTDVEIEFRPLDDTKNHTIVSTPRIEPTPTTRPFNLTVPHIPDLLWVRGRGNLSGGRTGPSTVGVAEDGLNWGVATYVLVALGMIPVVLGALILVRQILLKSKKKVLDESEYSSEYNRSPLPTKLPRLPAHLNWEETKSASAAPPPPTVPPPTLPTSVGTKWEFPRDKLRLQTVLGQGNFGQVWKAEADDISGHEGLTRLVAVKTVKEGSSQKEKEDLLRELGIMQELGAHPNVVTLLGCCTEKEPYLLIMEYVMYGKLLAFLREHRTRAHYFNFSDLSSALNSRDLTVFSYCVARGMEYLVSKGIIHRDLAARNILVDHNKLCKIADFGMSRNVRDTGEIYEQKPNRGALPIRWMAPESLHYNLFTHKSDVWSFGVLLWEIITLGSTPYNTMGAREVMKQVLDGYRLEKPKHCKSEFFQVLKKCWHSDASKRPTFSELKSEIGSLLGASESDGRFVDLEAMAEEMMDQDHH